MGTTHLSGPPSSLPPSPQLQPSAPPQRRSVSFDLEAGTQHEITPYAEVYGLHPSEFLFERHDFVLLLADEDWAAMLRTTEIMLTRIRRRTKKMKIYKIPRERTV